ncbi:putative serine/threonine-protein kinase [Canna indica]|uniref:[RNA-polymerase]-subunit kinase n=1 Tax=Canna indica TaxID=4628 RepID=A0AAQ3Q9C9_9LILI|nr:putative serine/threonine-protein kinase [Canna indica]
MGCICSKGVKPDGDGVPHWTKSLKEDDVEVAIADVSINGSSSKPQDDVATTLPQPVKERENEDAGDADSTRKGRMHHQRLHTVDRRPTGDSSDFSGMPNAAGASMEIDDVPSGFSGENAIAGWPAWLTSVAGEAIQGWQPRRAGSFEKLDKIGQGTYSTVYRARDLETGKIVALKKVRFVNMDPESVRFMAREIHILRQLNHPNVIKLEGIVASQKSCNLYLVFEYMEHDLAGLAARPDLKFTEPQVKCYMRQLLEGLDHCHSLGVLHRDIKGSNLLIDNNGILKIADFGLATSFNPDQKQPLTSRVVTLWYRPPELLLGATEYDVAVDLWSSGCILAELLAGKPVMPGRTEVEQLHKIFKLCGSPSDEYWKKANLPHTTIFKPHQQYRRCVSETFKEFPSSALTLLDSLLSIEPANRGTAASALDSEFFKTEPFACDPSSLPKYPPSKEYDSKLRNEEIIRQKTEASKEQPDSTGQGTRGTKAMDAHAELQKQQSQTNLGSSSRKYNKKYGIGTAQSGTYHSGMHTGEFGSSWSQKENQQDPRISGRSYSSVRVSNGPQLLTQRSYMHQPGTTDFADSMVARSTANSGYNRLDVVEPSDKHALDRPASTYKKDNVIARKDSAVGYGTRNKRIHYSGPLMPPGGNIEDMLKEHERHIQQAVRKARVDKTKKNK